jgi:hypothetical protein
VHFWCFYCVRGVGDRLLVSPDSNSRSPPLRRSSEAEGGTPPVFWEQNPYFLYVGGGVAPQNPENNQVTRRILRDKELREPLAGFHWLETGDCFYCARRMEIICKSAEDSGLVGGLRMAARHGSPRGGSMEGHGAGAPSLAGLRGMLLVSISPRRGAGLTTTAPTARAAACSHSFIAGGENGWAAHRHHCVRWVVNGLRISLVSKSNSPPLKQRPAHREKPR